MLRIKVPLSPSSYIGVLGGSMNYSVEVGNNLLFNIYKRPFRS
jgi:hypothetical protein